MKKFTLSKKLITSGIALTLVAAIVTTSVFINKTDVEAKETFQGIKDIVETASEEDPFKIIEVTPGNVKYTYTPSVGENVELDLSSGQIGYFIGGSEPVDFTDNLGKINNFTDRKAFVEKFIKNNGGTLEGPLAKISGISDNSVPLNYTDYRENYALTGPEVEEAYYSGIKWTKINFDGDHEDNAEGFVVEKVTVSDNEVTDNRLVKSFGKKKDTDGSDILKEYGIGGVGTYFDAVANTGDFDPAFKLIEGNVATNGNGYSIRFEANEGKAGYHVKEARELTWEEITNGIDIKINGETRKVSLSGNYLYKALDASKDYYACAGKYEEIDFSADGLSSGAYEEETDEDDQALEAVGDEDSDNDEAVDENPSEGANDNPDDGGASDGQPADNGDDNGTPGDGGDGNGVPDNGGDGNEGTPDNGGDAGNGTPDNGADGNSTPENGDDGNPAADNGQDANGDVNVASILHIDRLLDTIMAKGPKTVDDKKNSPDDKTDSKDEKKDDSDNKPAEGRDESDNKPAEGKDDEEKPADDNKQDGEDNSDTDDDKSVPVAESREDSTEDEAQTAVGEIDSDNDEAFTDEEYSEEDIDLQDEYISGASGDPSGYFLLSFVYENIYDDTIYHYSIDDMSGDFEIAAGNEIVYGYKFAEDSKTNYKLVAYPNFGGTGMLMSKDGYLADDDNPDPFRYEGAISEDDIMYGNYRIVYTGNAADKVRLFNVPTFYTGGIKNNEFFKKFVFDREYNEAEGGDGALFENVELSVSSLKPDAAVGIEPTGVGMIYLSAGTHDFMPEDAAAIPTYTPGTNDITPKWMKSVLSAVIYENLPIMVDGNLISDTKYNGTYIQLLAKILQLKKVDLFYTEYVEKTAIDDNFYTSVNKYLPSATSADGKKDDKWFNSDAASHHVNQSIYIYNRDLVNPVNTRFTDPADFTSDECFQDEIGAFIESENFYLKNDGKTQLIPKTINEAVAIKYIISYAGRRTAYIKTAINVLEIEPCSIPFSQNYVEDYEEKSLVKVDGKDIATDLNDHMSDGHLYVVKNTKESTYSLYRRNNSSYNKSNPANSGTAILKDQKSPITVTRMSTNEFIGRAEDINAQFDMVYIGMNTIFFKKKDDGRTDYNDDYMDGLVYANVGDKFYADPELAGLMDRDYDGGSIKGNTTSGGANSYRFSGNDLTKKRADNLLEFLKAGYPVIVDYNCFYGEDMKSTDVYDYIGRGKNDDHGYIDNCSNMYKFLYKAADKYGVNKENLIRLGKDGSVVSNAQVDCNKLLQDYINLPKPEIDINEGVSYTSGDPQEVEYVNGEGYMNFEFEILDRRSTDTDFDYTCDLYIDQNIDGRNAKYEKEEKVEIKLASTGEVVKKDKLKKGKTYKIHYKVPDGYGAPLPWKLVVSLKDNPERRDEEMGCYKIHYGDKELVNILQIVPDGSYTGWDLTNPGMGNQSNGGLDARLNSIDYYKVSKKAIPSAEFIFKANEMLNAASPTSILDYYDFGDGTQRATSVLVLGFARNYHVLTDAVPEYKQYCQSRGVNKTDAEYQADAQRALDLIVEYIKFGRSTVIGAGVTGATNANPPAGSGAIVRNAHGNTYNVNKALRDLVGQDRYGITSEAVGNSYKGMGADATSKNDTILNNADKTKREVCYKPNSANHKGEGGEICGYPQGYSTGFLSLCEGYNNMGSNNGIKIYNVGADNLGDDKYRYSNIASEMAQGSSAKLINRGTLSMYPYELPTDAYGLGVSKHPFYSLDLGTIDADGEQDVFVWYAYERNGSDKYIQPLDARDRYYLYTKDNITFINMSMPSGTSEEEVQLMCNVLISAYESGVKAPQVHIVDNEISKSDVTAIRIPYDDLTVNDSIVEGATMDMYYYSTGSQKSASLISTFYYRVDTQAESDLTKIINGEEIYLKKLPVNRVENATDPTFVVNPAAITIDGVDYNGYATKDYDVFKFNFNLKDTIAGKDHLDIYVEVDNYVEAKNQKGETVYSVKSGFDSAQLYKAELFVLD